MSSIPVPDERTHYSSGRQDDVDALAWPVFSQRALDLLRSAGEVLHPEPGELLWDTGDSYDLYLVLAGGVLLLDRFRSSPSATSSRTGRCCARTHRPGRSWRRPRRCPRRARLW
jgi:hypothetical protein